MPRDYLHNHSEFADLIRIVAEVEGIDPALVEKDYWIMHSLHGLQELGFTFQLKGGTSLSKGHGIIRRFSEDIDILIEPPPERGVKAAKNQDGPAQIKTRTDFYDWLAQTIEIDGISEVARDTVFDDVPNYRSAGIKLKYDSMSEPMEGLRDGVLLEVGFDTVAPNVHKDISSWAYDYAAGKVVILDNRAKAVPCYNAGYTFVEAPDHLDEIPQAAGGWHRSDRVHASLLRRSRTASTAGCARVHRHGRIQGSQARALPSR